MTAPNRAAFAALCLAVVALAARAADPPTSAPAHRCAARTFNSRLPLTVYQVGHPGDIPIKVGVTPSKEELEIPDCYVWGTEPSEPVDMAQLHELVLGNQIPGLTLSGKQDLAQLEGLTCLRRLTIGTTDDAGLAHLKALTALEDLNVSGEITDAGLESLKDLTSLERLNLAGATFGGSGLKYLKGLKHLSYLHLGRRWSGLSKDGWEQLGQLTSLRSLNLTEIATDAGLEQVSRLTDLEYLVIDDSVNLSDQGLACVEKLTKLKRLNFRLPHDSRPSPTGAIERTFRFTKAGMTSLRRALPDTEIVE